MSAGPTGVEIAATTTGVLLKAGPGKLLRICINAPGGATIRVVDSTDGSGTPKYLIGGTAGVALPAAGSVLEFGCNFFLGLWIVVATMTSGSITVVFE